MDNAKLLLQIDNTNLTNNDFKNKYLSERLALWRGFNKSRVNEFSLIHAQAGGRNKGKEGDGEGCRGPEEDQRGNQAELRTDAEGDCNGEEGAGPPEAGAQRCKSQDIWETIRKTLSI